MKTEEATATATTDVPNAEAPAPRRKASDSKRATRPAGKKTSKAAALAKRKPKVKAKSARKKTTGTVPETKSKKTIVLDLLRRKQGATTAEIAKATKWQNHSIRGFISGNVAKKVGLVVQSFKSDAGEHTYRIAK